MTLTIVLAVVVSVFLIGIIMGLIGYPLFFDVDNSDAVDSLQYEVDRQEREICRLRDELNAKEQVRADYSKDLAKTSVELGECRTKLKTLSHELESAQKKHEYAADLAASWRERYQGQTGDVETLAQELKSAQEELTTASEENKEVEEMMEYYGSAIIRLREKMWETSIAGLKFQLNPEETARLKDIYDNMTSDLLELGPPGPTWLFPPDKQAVACNGQPLSIDEVGEQLRKSFDEAEETGPLSEEDFLDAIAEMDDPLLHEEPPLELTNEELREAAEQSRQIVRENEMLGDLLSLEEHLKKSQKNTEPSDDTGGLTCGQDVPDPPLLKFCDASECTTKAGRTEVQRTLPWHMRDDPPTPHEGKPWDAPGMQAPGRPDPNEDKI